MISRVSEELTRFEQMLKIPFLDRLTTVLTTGNIGVVTTELLFCSITHLNKSSKYAFILKVRIEIFNCGMPMAVQFSNHEQKSEYLKNVFTSTYIKDVMEHNKVLKDVSIMDGLLDIISSSIGSLSNPTKLANTFRSEKI